MFYIRTSNENYSRDGFLISIQEVLSFLKIQLLTIFETEKAQEREMEMICILASRTFGESCPPLMVQGSLFKIQQSRPFDLESLSLGHGFPTKPILINKIVFQLFCMRLYVICIIYKLLAIYFSKL